MHVRTSLFILISFLGGCFWRSEKSPEMTPSPAAASSVAPIPTSSKPAEDRDRSLIAVTKYFDQADAIHREAWWVLTSERPPVGKTPFGKVQRALLSSQNVKLSNKSLFRCDRYLVRRDIMGVGGFPQKAEIFEKCSEKAPAKKIADFFASGPGEVQAQFYPENLEEILGLGATVLNRTIRCTLKGNEAEQLISLNCQDWAQDRTKEQMIRLDTYDYQKSGRNMIKLRGKVYENLSDTRKIEADVPLEGKILVTETELYPPEPEPTAAPPKGASTFPMAPSKGPAIQLTPENREGGAVPLASPPVLDPDVLMMQRNQQEQQPQPQTPPEESEMGEGGAGVDPQTLLPINPVEPMPGAESVPEPEPSPADEGGALGR